MRIGVHFAWQNGTDWERFLNKGGGRPTVSDQEIYEEELYLADLVEELGFDSYWAIDHYITPYGMTGGVLQHLTYMAGRTSKVDLGTMVLVLPWYDPVKVAHQISVLDNLLQGRKLTLGLGRGAAIREFDAFGIPMSAARGRYNESLEVLKLALTNEWFSFEGEHFKIPETSVRPAFRNPEGLLERLRVAWTSPESLPIAANGGLGMLMTNQKSWDEYEADMKEFNRIRAEHDWAPSQPSVVVRATCLESSDEAWDLMAKHSIEATRSTTNHYQLTAADKERFLNTKGYEQYAKIADTIATDEDIVNYAAKPQAWGTPDQVFDQLAYIQSKTSAEEFILNFKFGDMTRDDAERSMRLFAAEVLPRLQALEPTLHPEVLAAAGSSQRS